MDKRTKFWDAALQKAWADKTAPCVLTEGDWQQLHDYCAHARNRAGKRGLGWRYVQNIVRRAQETYDCSTVARKAGGAMLRRYAQAQGNHTRKATPLVMEDFRQAWVSHYADCDNAAERVVWRFCFLGFAMALRGCELLHLERELVEKNTAGFLVKLRRTKTNRAGGAESAGVVRVGGMFCPAKILEEQLAFAAREAGEGKWLFPKTLIHKGALCVYADKPFDYQSGNRVVKRLGFWAGVDKGVSLHSLRHGYVLEAKRRGIPDSVVMEHTRHKSAESFQEYGKSVDSMPTAQQAQIFVVQPEMEPGRGYVSERKFAAYFDMKLRTVRKMCNAGELRVATNLDGMKVIPRSEISRIEGMMAQ